MTDTDVIVMRLVARWQLGTRTQVAHVDSVMSDDTTPVLVGVMATRAMRLMRQKAPHVDPSDYHWRVHHIPEAAYDA